MQRIKEHDVVGIERFGRKGITIRYCCRVIVASRCIKCIKSQKFRDLLDATDTFLSRTDAEKPNYIAVVMKTPELAVYFIHIFAIVCRQHRFMDK